MPAFFGAANEIALSERISSGRSDAFGHDLARMKRVVCFSNCGLCLAPERTAYPERASLAIVYGHLLSQNKGALEAGVI